VSGQWEALIGGRWALWVGSVAIFLAVAFFMAYAWHALSDGGRLAVGLLAGFAFLAAGASARGRSEPWFSEGLTGGGLALQYLSLWAGAQRYGLIPLDHAFLWMTAVTILGVTLAVRYDAVSLSALSTIGGFLTPILLQSSARGSAQSLSLLTYVALLNAGLLAVSLFKRWQGITWLSFAATVALLTGWAGDSYTPALRWATFTFVTLYFLLFLGAACFYSLLRRQPTKPEELLLLFVDAFVYASAGYALLQGAAGSCPGAFPFALSLFFALVSFAADRLAPGNHAFGSSADGLTLFFLTIAVPIQLHQGWIAIAWSIEAAVLLILGRQLTSPLLQGAGHVVWLLSLVFLMGAFLQEPAPRLLFVNARALPLLVSVLTNGWLAVLFGSRDQVTGGKPRDDQLGAEELTWIYAAWSILGGAWLIAQETYLGFNWHPMPAAGTWPMGALFAIAALWALYSLAMFAFGWRVRHPGIRLNALIVAALATALPIAVGLTQPLTGWLPFWNLRWLSFVVAVLALGGLARLASRAHDRLEPAEAEILGMLPVSISILALCGISIDLYSSFGRWAIPSQASSSAAALFGLASFWSLFALLLAHLGLQGQQSRLRKLVVFVGAASVVLLLFNCLDPAESAWAPFWNLRWLSYLVVGLALGGLARRLFPVRDLLEPWEGAVWNSLPVGISLLALCGISLELYSGFRWWHIPSPASWHAAAGFGLASLWSAFALLLLHVGLAGRQPRLRKLAALIGSASVLLLLLNCLDPVQIGWMPFWNLRCAGFITAVLAMGGAARLISHETERLEAWEAKLQGILPAGISLLALCGASIELVSSLRWWQIPSPASWTAGAAFALASLWSLCAMAMLSRGLEWRQAQLRRTGYLVGAAGLVLLLAESLNPSGLDWTPLVNLRFLAFCLTAASLARVSGMLGARQSELDGPERELTAGSRLLLPIVVALWGLTQETYVTFRCLRHFFGAGWDHAAQMGISLAWTVCGVALLLGGIARRHQPVRLLGLGLLGLTASKVFLFDLSYLDMPYRTFSFGGLGLALIGISWLYSQSGERMNM
jgi:uncharacterized membrane protein